MIRQHLQESRGIPIERMQPHQLVVGFNERLLQSSSKHHQEGRITRQNVGESLEESHGTPIATLPWQPPPYLKDDQLEAERLVLRGAVEIDRDVCHPCRMLPDAARCCWSLILMLRVE